ncbi:MAG: HD-GYP domain-containing protein [Ilumatobacteraceae bacterium]|nr:HD-GYP domain-containing protein [Ilumatobacteraceae bacterium]
MNLARRYLVPGLLLACPIAVLLMLRLVPRLDVQFFDAGVHLVVIVGIATCAFATAAVAVAGARRAEHPGPVWLGVGCAGVGVLMMGHGLMTPGVNGREFTQWVTRFPHLAMVVFAVSLVIAGRRADWGPNRVVARFPLGSALVLVAPMVALLMWALVDDQALGAGTPPRYEESLFDVVSVVTIVLLLIVMVTHSRRWHLGRDIVQLAIVLAAGMSIAAVTAFQHGRFTQLSWWDYHAYLLAGFGAAVYAVFQSGVRERAISQVLGRTFSDNPFEHIEQGYPEALRSLVRAVEIKDAYTHGHSARTARVAVEIGLRMRLDERQLRVIARGAYLHDLGKIGIPDEILNKAGRLTDEERSVIETHPQLGYELASPATSLAEALPVILHHHERVDGGGYPHGLAGAEIPIEARVVAVADVWDALTSDRSYRRGWPAAEALAHIEAGAGTHFDTRAVDAMVALAADWGVRSTDDGEADQAWHAAQTCHELDSDTTDADADLISA